jgi:hypothetical protein
VARKEIRVSDGTKVTCAVPIWDTDRGWRWMSSAQVNRQASVEVKRPTSPEEGGMATHRVGHRRSRVFAGSSKTVPGIC